MRQIGRFLLLSLIGMSVMSWGLVLDAGLHLQDPTLVERESLFSITNPGHLMLFVGTSLTLVGLIGMAYSFARYVSVQNARGKGRASTLPNKNEDAVSERLQAGIRGSGAAAVLGLIAVAGMSLLQEGGISQTFANVTLHQHGEVEIKELSDGSLEIWTEHEGEMSVARDRTGFHVGPTVEELEATFELYTETKRHAVENYLDIEDARAEGFTVSNRAVQGLREDEAALHLINPEYASDGELLDPERPESLIYAWNGREHELHGVMYLAPLGERGPQVGGSITQWHFHPDPFIFCMDKWGVPYAEIDEAGNCPEGLFNQSPEMMHVWLIPNDFGAFAHQMSAE